jgi:tRNA wybutosine-synthesizing protein 4
MHYQSLYQQRRRYFDAGWETVNARSLWEYWEDPHELSSEEKRQLDAVEPFDEWEEFILFASHYFLLIAHKDPGIQATPDEDSLSSRWRAFTSLQASKPLQNRPITEINDVKDKPTLRRFGQVVTLSSHSAVVLGGIPDSRKYEIFAPTRPSAVPKLPVPLTAGHTITNISSDSFLLVGGRTSPSNASSQCFVYNGSTNEWIQVEDIEPARYRHCAVPISIDSFRAVLVYGGRTSDGEVLGDWQIWLEGYGWYRLRVDGANEHDTDRIRFGAAMLAEEGSSGILLGGLNPDKVLCNTTIAWQVTLGMTDEISLKYSRPGTWGDVHLRMKHQTVVPDFASRARFGAALIATDQSPWLIGGVGRTPNAVDCEIMSLGDNPLDMPMRLFADGQPAARPLFVGASAITLEGGDIIITGGGAVCFSFGQYTNQCWYQIRTSVMSRLESPCVKRYTQKDYEAANEEWEIISKWSIHQLELQDIAEMRNYTSTALEPWTMRSVGQGPCIDLWNLDYLETQIGPETKVPIHNGLSRNLQFHPEKNFEYQTLQFKELKQKINSGSHVYLRSLASTAPFQKPADLWHDFPSIAKDFHIPDLFNQQFNLQEKIHSSVLRLSGNVAVWLHYDVMSNFLFQIHGSKTVILFPPTSVVDLKFTPGATTSPVPIADIELAALGAGGKSSSNYDTTLETCKAVILHPGDVLFIPRFWPHATLPAEDEFPVSIAVNVFWRDLGSGNYAAGRDVYGSRDLGVYENGRKAVARIAKRLKDYQTPSEQVKTLAEWLSTGKGILDLKVKAHSDLEKLRRKMMELPKDVGAFYLPRLADELLKFVTG